MYHHTWEIVCIHIGRILLFRFIRIDGSTPAAERQRLVNLFQENADVKIAILSIKAAGVGLTMTVRFQRCGGIVFIMDFSTIRDSCFVVLGQLIHVIAFLLGNLHCFMTRVPYRPHRL